MPLPQYKSAQATPSVIQKEVDARGGVAFPTVIGEAEVLDKIASLPRRDVLLIECEDQPMEFWTPGNVISQDISASSPKAR